MKNSKERRNSASIMKSLLAASIIMMSAVSMIACGDSAPASVTGLSDSPTGEVVSYEPDTGGLPADQKVSEESVEEPSEDEYNAVKLKSISAFRSFYPFKIYSIHFGS